MSQIFLNFAHKLRQIKMKNMKKIFYMMALIALATSCSESLEDKAAREAKEYTEKVCPTPFVNDGRTDSTTFDKSTRTYTYYMTLRGKADNALIIKQNRKKLRDVQKQSLDNNPGLKKYKEAHFSFRFVYRSASKPNDVLMDDTFKY